MHSTDRTFIMLTDMNTTPFQLQHGDSVVSWKNTAVSHFGNYYSFWGYAHRVDGVPVWMNASLSSALASPVASNTTGPPGL